MNMSWSPARSRVRWTDDADAISQRVMSHLPMVRRIAWYVHGRAPGAIDLDELVQAGTVALVEAAQSYEDRGHAFATYAQVRVRGAMIDLIRRNATICRSAVVRRRAIADTRRRLELELGRTPTEAELADAMGIPAAEWRALVDATEGARHESLDDLYTDHSPWFADQSEGADERIDRQRLQQQLGAAIATLPQREALVLQLYFVEELNLDEIGATLGVGAARVCQIKKAALTKVRQMMEAAADKV